MPWLHSKKKVLDTFAKKDWYDVKATAMFNIRSTGKILVTRTQKTQTLSGIRGCYELTLSCSENWYLEQIPDINLLYF